MTPATRCSNGASNARQRRSNEKHLNPPACVSRALYYLTRSAVEIKRSFSLRNVKQLSSLRFFCRKARTCGPQQSSKCRKTIGLKSCCISLVTTLCHAEKPNATRHNARFGEFPHLGLQERLVRPGRSRSGSIKGSGYYVVEERPRSYAGCATASRSAASSRTRSPKGSRSSISGPSSFSRWHRAVPSCFCFPRRAPARR